jgi:hypothetical protein
MSRVRFAIRPLFLLLFGLGLLAPLSAVQAQDLSCDDFTSVDAAQEVLDTIPRFEDEIDPDGNGVACDEDEDNGRDRNDRNDRDDDDDRRGGNDDAELEAAYLEQVRVYSDDLNEQMVDFLAMLSGDAEWDTDAILAYIEAWSVAATELEDEFPDVPEAYETLLHEPLVAYTTGLGEVATTFSVWIVADEGTAARDAAFDEFLAAVEETQGWYAAVDFTLDEAGY